MNPPPFHPLPIEEHRDRYKTALETLYDDESIGLGSLAPPYECPRQIFDFDDGMRMYIARLSVQGRRYQEILATCMGQTDIAHNIHSGMMPLDDFYDLALERFRAVSSDYREYQMSGPFSGQFPRWVRPEDTGGHF